MNFFKVCIIPLLLLVTSCNLSINDNTNVVLNLYVPISSRAELEVESISLTVTAEDMETINTTSVNSTSITVEVPVGDSRTFDIEVKLLDGTVLSGQSTSDIAATTTTVDIVLEYDSVDVTSITITSTQPTEFKVGDTYTMTAEITPTDATDQTITWSSDDTSVTTVSSSGVVTAISVGEATITATASDGTTTDFQTITVKATADITIVMTTPTDIDVNFGTFTGSIYYLDTEGTVITVESTETITSCSWYLDGDEITGETGTSYTLIGSNVDLGTHTLSVIAEINGESYSSNITFSCETVESGV